MTVTIRATFPSGTTVSTGTTSTTTSVTASAGDVLRLHVVCDVNSPDGALSVTATANSIAADGHVGPIHSGGGTAGFHYTFWWLAPASGTYNVVATVAGGTPNLTQAKVWALSGTDNLTAPSTNSSTGNSTSASLTSPAVPVGGLVMGGYCAGSAFSAVNQTVAENTGSAGSGAGFIADNSAAGAGATVSLTGTLGADFWSIIADVWAPSGSGGANPGITPPSVYERPGPGSGPRPVGEFSRSPWHHGTFVGPTSTGPMPPFFTDDVVGGPGNPMLVVCEDAWGLIVNAGLNNSGNTTKTFNDYFAARAAQGYNAVEVSLLGYGLLSGGSDTSTKDSDGTTAWSTDTDPSTTPNATYWARRDAFFTAALRWGFLVFANTTTTDINLGAYPASWTTAQWQAYGTFLGGRYASVTNVMWIVGDDYFGTVDTGLAAWLTNMRAAGANQWVSIQNDQESTSRQVIDTGGTPPSNFGPANAQFNWGYSYNPSYDVVEKAGKEASPIPYGWMDGFYLASSTTGIITDVNLERRMLWWALSSGAKSVSTGDNDIWSWGSTALAQVTAKSIYTSQMPAIARFFRSLPNWHQLVADTSSLLVTAGRGTHVTPIASGGGGTQYTSNTDSYVTASRTPTGTLAVVYMSHASTITINEAMMGPGYQAMWVDPASGALTSTATGPTYSSSGLGNNSVGDADWVLVLMQPVGALLPVNPRPRRGLPRLRRTRSVDPVPTQTVVVTNPFVPETRRRPARGMRLVRRGPVAPVQGQPPAPASAPRAKIRGLLRIRRRPAEVVPPQVATPPPLVPEARRRPSRAALRRRSVVATVPPPVDVPQATVRRPVRAWFTPRRRPVEVTPVQVGPETRRRAGRPVVPQRRRARVEVVPPQVAPTPPVLVPEARRRLARGVLPRRGKTAEVVTPQTAVPPPKYPAQIPRRPLKGIAWRKGRSAEVVPAQQAAPQAPKLVPQPPRRGLKGIATRKGRTAEVHHSQQQPAPPARTAARMPRRALRPVRRRPVDVVPPQTVPTPPRLVPQTPAKHVLRAVPRRGRTATPPPGHTQPPVHRGQPRRPIRGLVRRVGRAIGIPLTGAPPVAGQNVVVIRFDETQRQITYLETTRVTFTETSDRTVTFDEYE